MAVAVVSNPTYFEMERNGEIDQVLVALRYVGDNRRYSNRSVATQGLWPEYNDFRQGAWHVGFVPESPPEGVSAAGVAWFERNPDFEVEFDPANIARILLDGNYVELTPAGPIGERDTLPGYEDRLHEELGLQSVSVAGSYREQLKELAGLTEEDVTPSEETDPVNGLVNQFTRGELKEAVKRVREDTGHFNLRGKSMEDMVEFLVDEVDDAEHVVREVNV